MGTWGYGIFSDDVATEVRDTYRELLGEGVEDDEAARRVLEESRERGARPTLVWLALAASQSQVGRLSPEVKSRALGILDDGSELRAWPADGQRRRNAALVRLRETLTGPQPARRAVRRGWKPKTDLAPGDVLAVTVPEQPEQPEQSVRLLRVVLVERDRHGSWPMLELLDYRGAHIPALDEIAALPSAFRMTPTGNRAGVRRWLVSEHHKADPGWEEVGFKWLGRIPAREGDATALTNELASSWPDLRTQLLTLAWFEADRA